MSKSIIQSFLFIFLSFMLFSACKGGDTVKEPALSDDKLYTDFQNPGPEWRSKPFWSWNGKLEEGELVRQLEAFKEMGMGGAFFHSRVGLKTEYLGDEWFDLTNACADASEKLGIEAWLYDEDRWPSGSAGGDVTRDYPEFRSNHIQLYVMPAEEFKWDDTAIVSAFVCDLDGINYSNLKQINKDEDMAPYTGKTALKFVHEWEKPSSGYNDATYLDVYNPKATQKYIDLTHERYKEECGDRIGSTILGIFTDEPHRGGLFSTFGGNSRRAPWSPSMLEEYKKMFGGDLAADLPKLFLRENGERVNDVKWKFCELTQSLFLQNFAKPQLDWCHDNNMIYTGHVLHENNFTCQVTMQGNMLRYYEYMDYPGVDMLTEHDRAYWVVKQLSSVARQLGQKWLLSELYGCTGWQFDFEDHKAVGDWQALFGINLRCPHLSWYTMEGEAKRDYPASISYQSAWWKEYSYVEDYFSRLGLILTQGKPECDLLVVTPIESVWSQVCTESFDGLSAKAPEIIAMEKRYADMFHWLAGARIDFDYGDEDMMGRLCKVTKDKVTGEPVLQFGEATYRAMLIGDLETMRSSTLELAKKFKKAGGKVIFAGEAPKYVDVKASEAPAQLAASCIRTEYKKDDMVKTISEAIRPVVEVRDINTGRLIDDIFGQVRKDDNRYYVVLMSMDREKNFENVEISIPYEGEVTEWNPRSGEVWTIQAKAENGRNIITSSFEPIEEKIYVISEQAPSYAKEKPKKSDTIKTVELPTSFDYALDEPNICVLDLATFQIDNGEVQPLDEILKIDQKIRRHFKMPLRGGAMLQPWYAELHDPSYNEVAGKVSLSFPFNIKDMPKGDLYLCLETPDRFNISVNGKPLTSSDEGWFIDNSIRKFALPASILTSGANRVEISCDFARSIDFEAMYIIGDFGVELNGNKRTLTTLPTKLKVGNIVDQNLPFYSGGITYYIDNLPHPTDNEKILFDVESFSGACIKTDDQVAGWFPYQLDLTKAAKEGKKGEVTLMLTRRNTFGPLHALPALVGAYGPGNWTTGGKNFTLDEYVFLPAGLTSQPKLTIQ